MDVHACFFRDQILSHGISNGHQPETQSWKISVDVSPQAVKGPQDRSSATKVQQMNHENFKSAYEY